MRRETKPCPFYGMPCEYVPMAEKTDAAAARIQQLEAALRVAAHELELLYFFAISNGIAEAGVPPHVAARAALEGK